jgi:hypothetical protein
MRRKGTATWLLDDVADFLAACPSRDEYLAYRPSPQTQEHLSELLAKAKRDSLTADEQRELQQFEYVEILIQAVKARLRSRRAIPS